MRRVPRRSSTGSPRTKVRLQVERLEDHSAPSPLSNAVELPFLAAGPLGPELTAIVAGSASDSRDGTGLVPQYPEKDSTALTSGGTWHNLPLVDLGNESAVHSGKWNGAPDGGGPARLNEATVADGQFRDSSAAWPFDGNFGERFSDSSSTANGAADSRPQPSIPAMSAQATVPDARQASGAGTVVQATTPSVPSLNPQGVSLSGVAATVATHSARPVGSVRTRSAAAGTFGQQQRPKVQAALPSTQLASQGHRFVPSTSVPSPKAGPVDEGTGVDWTWGNQYFHGDHVCQVDPAIPQADTDLWWFDGVQPRNYGTQILLTAVPDQWSSDPFYTWTITSGADKVAFMDDNVVSAETSYTSYGNTIQLISKAASTALNDVVIKVSNMGTIFGTVWMAVPRPDHLVHLYDVDNPDANFGYQTDAHYKILDQFNNVLPNRVNINEKWTSAIGVDFPGTNWRRCDPDGANVNPADWKDEMQGENPPLVMIPMPINPGRPVGNMKVIHWSGAWYVGSKTPGEGVKVQTNTWQKYTDHTRHEDVVSPP